MRLPSEKQWNEFWRMHFDLVGKTEENGWTVDKCKQWAKDTPQWYTQHTIDKKQREKWYKESKRIFGKHSNLAILDLDIGWKNSDNGGAVISKEEGAE